MLRTYSLTAQEKKHQHDGGMVSPGPILATLYDRSVLDRIT